jgi:hypothetical protein
VDRERYDLLGHTLTDILARNHIGAKMDAGPHARVGRLLGRHAPSARSSPPHRQQERQHAILDGVL